MKVAGAMTDNLENLATVIMLFLLVPLIVLSIYSRMAARRSRAVRAQSQLEFNRRLQDPRLADLERYFDRPLPETLKRLYQDSERILTTNFIFDPPGAKNEYRAWLVASFLPADMTTLEEGWAELGENNFPFACDDFGDPYYIPLDQASALDGPVFHFHHEGGDRERVAESLADFLSWPSRPHD
jgi:hypothetical protein